MSDQVGHILRRSPIHAWLLHPHTQDGRRGSLMERSTALATGLEQTKFAAASYPTNQLSENTEEQYHGTYWHHHLQGQPDDS